MSEEEKPSLIENISRYLPAVEKPTYKQTFNTKMKWTVVVLAMYFVLSYISIWGLQQTSYEQFRFYEVVLGSKFGSLMTLGIGPIVTGGIILQLLVGSKIINWDTTKPEGREKFQAWNKFISVCFCFLMAVAYVLAGALPITGGSSVAAFVIIQLAAGGIIVLLMDELVSKWGFGSGISLFIASGVGSQILIRVLSPFTAACVPGNIPTCIPSAGSYPSGLFWVFLLNIFAGDSLNALINFIPILSTVLVFFLVVYAQDIRIEVPLTFGALRGFGRSWDLKLFYTSNIPVILTAALLTNLQLLGRVGLTPTEAGLSCSMLGCFDQSNNPVSGVIYYLSTPRNLLLDLVSLTITSGEILRAITYLTFMAVCSMVFSIFWVSTSGMDAGSVAEQLEDIGLQIPGYRQNKGIVQSVLNRYIPPLAVLGGLCVGLLAAFADFTGALGTGTGILLTVMIVYQFYEQLKAERLEEAHPLIRAALEE